MASPSELNAKIQDLEKQVKALEQKLSEYTSIEKYYLQKYEEIYNEAKNSRDSEIKHELENMAVEISVLKQEKEDLTDALAENELTERKIKEIDIQLNELYKLTESISLDAESEINDLEQIGLQTLVQHKEQVNKYVKKIEKLLNPPFIVENINFLKDTLMNYLSTEGFECVKTLKENHRKALKINETLKIKNKDCQDTITQLLIDRESLLDKYREMENIDINHMQDEIVRFTIHHENYLREMMASLDNTREIHENLIIDRIKKYSILDYTKKEIGEALDDMLVIFSQELLTIDSVENKTYQKEKRLKKLQIEAERLRKLDIEKETLYVEYKELQNKYLTMQKQVGTIEDFNSKVHNTIDNNDQYHNLAENYLGFMHFENEVNKKLADKAEELAKYDGVASEEAENAKKQITAEIDALERSLEEGKMHIESLVQNPENEKVLKMLLSVIEYETKLPTIYETLKNLKKQIDEKHDRLNYLKEQLVEYQSILMQIEGLTNED